MDKFLEKWKEDKKFRAKMKLLLYGVFLLIIIIYANSLNSKTISSDNDIFNTEGDTEAKITIPEKYTYDIKIEIDDENYKYSGEKNTEELTIVKEHDNITKNYIYKDGEYYIKDNDLYVKTTKEEVYDQINSNYINFDTINNYLTKATTSNDNQYLVYLKDVILGNDTEDYFTILINDDKISIDYTPLMKQFNSDIKKYKVSIQIDEIE